MASAPISVAPKTDFGAILDKVQDAAKKNSEETFQRLLDQQNQRDDLPPPPKQKPQI